MKIRQWGKVFGGFICHSGNGMVCLFAAAAMSAVLLLSGCGTEKEYAGSLVKGFDRSKATGTSADMKAISTALEAYRLDEDQFPSAQDMTGLAQALSPDYLRVVPRTDKWGHPFSYRGGTDSYRLISVGEDGRQDTGDDLVLETGQFVSLPEGMNPPF